MAEEGRIAVRNVRRDVMHHLKELVHKGEVGADEEHRAEERVQKLTGRARPADRRAAEEQRPSRSKSRGLVGLLTRTRSLRGAETARAGARRRYRSPSRSSWTATAAGPPSRAARSRRATGRGRARCRRTVEAAIDLGVESLAVYAFSTENWSRPPSEVDSLMEIFGETIEPRAARPRRRRASARASSAGGPRVPPTCGADGGARGETADRDTPQPLDRVRLRRPRRARRGRHRRIVERRARPRTRSTRACWRAQLYAPEMPNPDLLIRTSGELRISNFLLWQLAYAELVFADTLWPDFGRDDLRAAVAEYAASQRPLRRRRESR